MLHTVALKNIFISFVLFLFFCSAAFAGKPVPGFSFTENKGQLAAPGGKVMNEILYYGKGGKLSVYFTAGSLIFVERQDYKVESEASLKARAEGNLAKADELEARSKFYRFDMIFDGTSKAVVVEPSGAYEQASNYYLGHCPDGILGVKSYNTLRYKNLYPGIDLVYRNDESGLKYEFIVLPGADASLIKWHYEGLDGMQLKEDGSLEIKGKINTLADKAPYTYTEAGQKIVASHFVNKDGNMSYALGDYSKKETLVIDPTLSWGTYFDAPSTTWDAISFTSNGDWFSACYEYTATPPFFNAGTWYDNTHGGGTDILIVKFASTGQQLWTTFYGGSGYEYHINNTGAVDGNNNFYLCGETGSTTDWPLYNPGGGAYYDGTFNSGESFILKFSSNGTRLWSTLFGGSSSERIRGVTTYNNELFIVGETYSTDLPVQSLAGAYNQTTFGGGQDGFIVKFSSAGAKQWCTYYGGNGYENFADIWIDPVNNNLLAVGEIGGWSAPSIYPNLTNPGGGAYYDNTVNGKQDLLIVKLNSSRALTWSTIYGGSTNDNINGDCGGVRTDGSGNIYVVGKTTSNNLPLQDPGGGAYYQSTIGLNGVGDSENDGFILKFNSSGVRQWATYYGGSSSEEFRKVKIDLSNNIWIGGYTYSSNVPLLTKAGSYNQTFSGGDALFIQFNQAGVRQWASCYGGSGFESCRPFGIYQASACGLSMVAIDYTSSTNLPLSNPGSPAYYDNSNAASNGVFIVKMSEGASGGAATGTITWTGAVSTDWFNPCNWDKSAVPTTSNPVVIPNTTNKPHINDNTQGDANCYTIEINSDAGAMLFINSDAGGRLNVVQP